MEISILLSCRKKSHWLTLATKAKSSEHYGKKGYFSHRPHAVLPKELCNTHRHSDLTNKTENSRSEIAEEISRFNETERLVL